MTRNGKILAGAAVILALGSAAAVAHRHGGWHHGGGPGWGGHSSLMGFAGPLCRGDVAERADFMLVRIEHRIKPTDAQKPALEELETAVRSAAAKVAAACPTPPAPAADGSKPASKDVPTRLAEAEAQLTATLEGLKIVRPAAEKLYAALDDAQKQAVSKIGKGRYGNWGRHHDRGPRDERGPGRGPDAGPEGTPAPDRDL